MKTVVSSSSNTTSETPTSTNNASANGEAIVVPKTEPDATAAPHFQLPTGSVGANKRPLSLDLNKQQAKKQRLVAPLTIDSPDLKNRQNINTPEIETFLLSNNLVQTPQPGVVFPTKVGLVTSEQEAFGKGFEEALHSLHNSQKTQNQLNNSDSNNTSNANTVVNASVVAAIASTSSTTGTTTTGMSGGSFTYANLDNSFPVTVKEEPQNSTASPPVSPIDMETQEKIKLERKRQRNRVAASKCRKRKLERISKLEDKVKILKGENGDLALVVKSLKDQIAQLKQQVIDHVGSGCTLPPLPTAYNGSSTLLQSK